MSLYERTLNVFLGVLLLVVVLSAWTDDLWQDRSLASLEPLSAALPALAPPLPGLETALLVAYGRIANVEATIDDRGAHLEAWFTTRVNFTFETQSDGTTRVLLYPVDGPSVAKLVAEASRAGLVVDVTLLARFSYQLGVKTTESSSAACGGAALSLAPGSHEGTATRMTLDLVPAVAPSLPAAHRCPGRVRPVRVAPTQRAQVHPGLALQHYLVRTADGASSHAACLEIDPAEPSLRLALGTAPGGMRQRMTLSRIAHCAGAIGAINASYFASNGDPLGLLIEDGRLESVPLLGRTSIGVYQRTHILFGNPVFSGKVVFAGGELPVVAVNEKREDGGVVVYTPRFGKSTRTGSSGLELAVIGDRIVARVARDGQIPTDGQVIAVHGHVPFSLASLKVGDSLAFQYGLTPPWNLCDLAVGVGPRLVQDGELQVSAAGERFARGFDTQRAPRSAIGVTGAGNLLLAVVDGRHAPRDRGVTLVEMAQVMIALGARDAMNLDGGGSTVMVVGDKVVNTPSDLKEREISTGLLVCPVVQVARVWGEQVGR